MKDGRKVVGFAVQVIRLNSSPMSVVKTGSVIPSAGCLLCPDERTQDALACPKSATTRLMHRSKRHNYSTTPSAIASTPAGITRPSVLAVLRLMINSNAAGLSINRDLDCSLDQTPLGGDLLDLSQVQN